METNDALLQLTPARTAQSRRTSRRSAYDLTFDELTAYVVERGLRPFRAQQLFRALYHNLACGYDDLHVLPKAVREQLAAELPLGVLTPVRELETDDGETLKVLYRLPDGHTVETVLMFYPERATVCVSCQVGCAVGCSFCATGMGGLQRNLTAGEIVAQVVDMARRSRARGRPLTNLVMMGMGEPFHNYAATMKLVGIINDARGMDFGARRITISTSGIVPFIDRLAEEPYQVNLAVSIHAGNDELRSSLVPINQRWPIDELIAACRRYVKRTGRRVSFEYALMAGVNGSPSDAAELAARIAGLLCHVNVIPYNPTPGANYRRPTPDEIEAFVAVLRARGVPVSVRYSRGVDIGAACGQLRAQEALA